MADPPLPAKNSVLDLLAEGFQSQRGDGLHSSRIEQIGADSAVSDLIGHALGHGPSGYSKVFNRPDTSVAAKAAYVLGRLAHDLIEDGSRIPYWLLNHPLAQVAVLSELGTQWAGLSPNYRERAAEMGLANSKGQANTADARYQIEEAFADEMNFRVPGGKGTGIPLGLARGVVPLTAATALTQASGNHDMLNIMGGGRQRGYEAVLPSESDAKQTVNAPAEILMRYVLGRSGRLLPWEEFTQERPDVSPQDYGAAKAHQFDKGLLDVGLLKGTGRNLDGEPEVTMMGFRVPMSAAASAAGAIAGAAGGSRLAEKLIGDAMKERRKNQIDAATEKAHPLSLRMRGNQRLLGAAAGGVAGAFAGNLGSRVVNDAVIQPTFYPQRVADEQAWLLQQQALASASNLADV